MAEEKYKVKALYVGGSGNKVFKSGDEVTASNFPPGTAKELVNKGFLEKTSSGSSKEEEAKKKAEEDAAKKAAEEEAKKKAEEDAAKKAGSAKGNKKK